MARWEQLSAAEMDLLQTVFWAPGTSRTALAERLDYSKSKANALAAGLVEQGLLEETGLQVSSGGRRPETLQVARGLGVIIGVDLGATSLDVAVMRPDLTLLATAAKRPTCAPAPASCSPGCATSSANCWPRPACRPGR